MRSQASGRGGRGRCDGRSGSCESRGPRGTDVGAGAGWARVVSGVGAGYAACCGGGVGAASSGGGLLVRQ